VKRAVLSLLVALAGARAAAGQEFQPPPPGGGEGGTRLGLYGFGARAGVGVSGGGEGILGITLDLGDLLTSRVRLRPSGEIGFDGERTYVASLEALWRLTRDVEPLVPYVGGGMSVAGHDACGSDAACPGVWLNLALGVEGRIRATFNWLIEYHAMDALRQHRFYIGLTTRRGS
jgi:hypothetical protein